MDAPDGQSATALNGPVPSTEALSELRLGFVPLVRLLERLTPDAVRVGGEGPLASEGIRFRHDRALQFHAGDVVGLEREEAEGIGSRYLVTSAFLGLSGAMSPLPAYLAEELVFEDDEHPLRRDFYDLFHHRLLSLFFRAVVRYRLSTEHTAGLDDGWTHRSLALGGVDAYLDPPPGGLSKAHLLRLAPLLVRRSRGPRELEAGLRTLLEPHLDGAPITVQECTGRWSDVDESSWTRLGRACTRLGQDLLVGRRLFDRAGSYAVRVGPTTWSIFERFREGGDLHQITRELIGWLVRDPLDWVIVVLLLPRETPGLQLSAQGTSRLGRSTWLRTRDEETALVIDPLAHGRKAVS